MPLSSALPDALQQQAAACAELFRRKPTPVACGYLGADGAVHLVATNPAWDTTGSAWSQASAGSALADACRQGTPFTGAWDDPGTGTRWQLSSFCPQPGVFVAELQDTTAVHRDRTKARMFDAVAASSEVSIVTQDLDGVVTSWNRRAEEMFGYSAEFTVGKKLPDYLPDADRERELALLEKIRRADPIAAIEVTRQRQDGSSLDVTLVLSPILDCEGRVVGLVRMARDVTERNRTLRELESAERRLRSIIEATTVPLALNDNAGNITYLNTAFTLTFGYTRDDIPTLPLWWEQAYPDPIYRQHVIDDWGQRLNESLRTNEPFCPVEVVVRCKNGTDRTVIATASDLGSAFADTHLVSLFDITELVHARQALQRSERYANLVLASVGDGLIQIDVNGIITYINPVGARLLGHEPAEAIGKLAHALFHHSRADGSPYPLEECPVHASLAQRTTRLSDTDVFWRKDGTSFPVNFVSAPMATAEEHFGAVVTFRDISAEVDMRETLLENEVMIRKAQEIAGFGSYATDLTTGKWKSSPVLDWIFGIDDSFPHDIPHWNELLAPEWRQPSLDHYLEVAAGKCDFRMDYEIIRPRDGVRRWIAANGELEFDADGKPVRLIGTIQDIQDRKMIEAALKKSHDELEMRVAERTHELAVALDQAEAAKNSRGEFLAKMSHEIRTPLNAIQGLTYLALKQPATPELHTHLTKIRDSGKHLLSIISDILDFSKIDAGKLELEASDFDLGLALQQVIELVRVRATEKNLTLALNIAPDVPARLHGDSLRICQVLLNYLSNAVKFTEVGSVELCVHRVAHAHADDTSVAALCFEVRDSGIGLTQQQQQRMFQSFEQADNSTSRKYGGTGLGLAISRQLVQLMGGEVGVRSAPGQGSTFWFNLTLPVAQFAAPASEDAARITLEQYRAMLQGHLVLVVDDNEFNLDVAAGLLTEVGITPMLAQDGEQALGLLRATAFDAVLMDVQMPVMDGLEATRQIRNDAQLRGLRVIALTANALTQDRQRYLHAGMDDVLTKPIDPDRMFALLAHWLVGASKADRQAIATAATPAASESAMPTGPEPALFPLWDADALVRYVGDNVAIQQRLIHKYLSGVHGQLAELDAAVQSGNWQTVGAIAHKLKSASQTIGALRLGACCQAIETSARTAQADDCRAAHAALQDCARGTLQCAQEQLDTLAPPGSA